MARAAAMCLVCVFDGLRPDMVRPDWTPNLWRLRERGVWFTRSHCAFPSVTRVNSAALATGSFPGTHGLEGNTIWRPAVEPERRLRTGEVGDLRRLRAAQGRLLGVPTAAEVLARAGLRAVALGTGSSGGALLQHPEAEATGGLLYHHDFTTPPELAQAVATALGPPPAAGDYGALALARVEYAARALTDVLIPVATPALAAFWITVPDGLHHRFGLGAPAAVAAIREADATSGRMLDRLAQQGLAEALDVFVTADHGYATVSGHVDVGAELVRAGLKQARDSTDVVLCADGGGCLVYANSSVDVEALSAFLLAEPWIGAVFSRGSAVPGTLPLAAVGCEGPHAPDLIAALAWDDGVNQHGIQGMSRGQGSIAVGAGDHGGISPFEMRNMLFAAGPHFREGLVSDAPCGIVDVAPTVLHCLGVPAPAEWDGRVLVEALRDGTTAPRVEMEEQSVAFARGRQLLTVARSNGVTYTAGASVVRA